MTKIILNNKEFQIDDATLAPATAELKSHLSTVMNGEGASITFGGTAYNIDQTKLSTATNDFISHLGTISGSGSKVVVGGVEYSVSSDKMAGAIAELECALDGLSSGGGGNKVVEFNGDLTGWECFDASGLGLDENSILIKVSDSYTSKTQLEGTTVMYNYAQYGLQTAIISEQNNIAENIMPDGSIAINVFRFCDVYDRGGSQRDEEAFVSIKGDISQMGFSLPEGTYFVVYPEQDIYIVSISCITE